MKAVPEFGGGSSSKLTEGQKEELREMLKEKDFWTTKEVQELIEAKFGLFLFLAGKENSKIFWE